MQITDERFWSKVDKQSNGCWIWTAGKKKKMGYGLFYSDKYRRTVLAHRMAYELSVGLIPDGLHVLHHCDNPSCVRPDHLFLGTETDNAADRNRKGRQSRGEQIHTARLDTLSVLELRVMYKNGGWSHRMLARRYGVTSGTITRAINHESWKSVSEI